MSISYVAHKPDLTLVLSPTSIFLPYGRRCHHLLPPIVKKISMHQQFTRNGRPRYRSNRRIWTPLPLYSMLVSMHKVLSLIDDIDLIARVLPQLRATTTYSYHTSPQISGQDDPLHLRLAFSYGASIRSHIYVERQSFSPFNRICQAGCPSQKGAPSIVRRFGIKCPGP